MTEKKTQSINILEIRQQALDRIESILDALKIEWVHRNRDYINIICPVHQSQDLGSCCIYLSNGRYKCWSRGCDEEIGPNFIDLIRWALSQNNTKYISWADVQSFINGGKFDINARPISEREEEPLNLMDPCKYPSITIPSKYYIDRGFSPEVLNKFGVGDTEQFPYTGRALVPVKTEDGKLMGFSGRSSYNICGKCNLYHSRYQACIAKDYEFAHMYKKWFHSKGMQKTRTLYGISEANQTANKIAIVEGPSCVWRLSEHGIPAGAVLGKTFSPIQAKILTKRKIDKIFLLSDQDDGGAQFKKSFVKDWASTFKIYVTTLPKKDVSDMTAEEIEEFIVKKWEKI